MNCHCGHIHTHAAALRYDPTKTTTLRRRFEGEAARRFRALKGKVNRLLVEEDAFGLKTNLRQYAFPRSADKVSAFMAWLDEQQREGLLDVRPGVPMSRAAEASWMALYIRSAYARGMAQSAATLRASGVEVADDWVTRAFTRNFHADRVGLAYTRAFEELRGITSEMDRQISRTLAEGLSAGEGPRKLAARINNRVDRIGITRARMLARTETIRSHAEASLNSYEEAGIMGVGVQAEWRTAQDAAVCAECEAAARAGPYALEDARGMIPLHPNCRCAWVPVVNDPREVRLQ